MWYILISFLAILYENKIIKLLLFLIINYNHGIKDELTPLYHVGTSNSPVKINKTPFTTYSSLDNPTSLMTMSLMLIASSFGTGLTRSL